MLGVVRASCVDRAEEWRLLKTCDIRGQDGKGLISIGRCQQIPQMTSNDNRSI
jgi:hypothetical protein